MSSEKLVERQGHRGSASTPRANEDRVAAAATAAVLLLLLQVVASRAPGRAVSAFSTASMEASARRENSGDEAREGDVWFNLARVPLVHDHPPRRCVLANLQRWWEEAVVGGRENSAIVSPLLVASGGRGRARTSSRLLQCPC